ncbi:dolichyl-phosphate-mannose--protein mannosyltransferase 1 [Trichomonascus vanleenenianus]|uniref:putative dolichyl-phosphate-mannose--protein mannosyltransferase n=1 Tax=Trichomonascus vanleenenianus TaxID=2268995 RepID=UPI003ECB95CB
MPAKKKAEYSPSPVKGSPPPNKGSGYRKATPPAGRAKERALGSKGDKILLTIVAVVACIVRYWKLWQPSSVVFDEVHFGGFARKYIIGRFFMDVHPPLAKMLYAVVGYLAGYDGEFEFKTIGLDYIEPGVPYVAMRMLPATLGILTVLLSYATLRASGCRKQIAFFGALLVTVDNALVTQSRYILLDSPLLFFIAITAYAFKKFENEEPFGRDWFRYLLLTGLGLGATVSSKWVGLFTIGWVGLLTLYQLWWLLGDLSVTPRQFGSHFLARASLLIGVPLTFYLAMFALHFVCLVNTGDGASFMSPEFQASLQHTKLNSRVPADVAYGSELTIRHLNTQGGYLHSHDHLYQTGSKQQQITLYPHKDANNIWVLEKVLSENETAPLEPEFVEDGAIVRLRHKPTYRRLHSHDHRPPISEQDHQNEVSAYGYKDFPGDLNDNFRVEIVEKKSAPGVARQRLRTLDTKFKLIHTTTGCTLFSHTVKLPKWAFEQQEVTCIKGGILANSIWFIEENSHPQFGADVEMTTYRKPSFLSKFLELNKVMWRVNAGLTDSHTWESRPQSWPLMLRGINFWGKDHRQVYLLGNGPIWWTMTALIVVYVAYKGIWLLRWQRGYRDFEGDSDYATFDYGFGSYLLGWAIHYFPSFLMARQLFLHHYLGSLYFGILALAQFWEFLTARLVRNKIVSTTLTVLFFTAAGGWLWWFSPLAYGDKWTKDLCLKSTFLDMDYDCDRFFNDISEYKEYDLTASQSAQTAAVSEVSEEQEPEPEAGEDPTVDEEEQVFSILPVDEGMVTDGKDDIGTFKGEQVSAKLLDQVNKVEYRDPEGNLLNEDEVQRLVAEGLVELQTQYTQKSRFYDQQGNEIDPSDVEGLKLEK